MALRHDLWGFCERVGEQVGVCDNAKIRTAEAVAAEYNEIYCFSGWISWVLSFLQRPPSVVDHIVRTES